MSAVPDRAQVSFGVSTIAKTASAALRANAAEMTKVIAAIKGQGIGGADIRTDLVSLSPRYSQSGDAVVGYEAANSVSATLRALDKIGPVIDAPWTPAPTRSPGPNLVRADAAGLYRAALRAAIANAKAKARTIAGASGLHLRRITDVTEASAAPVPTPLAKAGTETSTPVETGHDARRGVGHGHLLGRLDLPRGLDGERGRVDPGRPRRLVRGDLVGMLEREADVVEAVQELVPPERVEVEDDVSRLRRRRS